MISKLSALLCFQLGHNLYAQKKPTAASFDLNNIKSNTYYAF
jgi:hypothetical protein